MYNYSYPRPAVTCDIILITKQEVSKILLIKRRNNPYKNCWALPGGFVDMNETLEQSASRELVEETGIDIQDLKQFRTYGDPNRDPRHRTITVAYYRELEGTIEARADDDACQAEWFHTQHLPDLAFDHAEIISDFLASLS